MLWRIGTLPPLVYWDPLYRSAWIKRGRLTGWGNGRTNCEIVHQYVKELSHI